MLPRACPGRTVVPFWPRPTYAPSPPCSTLFGLALSNLGVVPAEAPHVYGVVNAYLLPLAVPLLLFSADLRCALLPPCYERYPAAH